MNRTITEPYGVALPADRQGEFFHRYILGVYDLYARLTAAFPDILFESCAGGGGRFDPGMLAFAPQAWTSDDTDAVERLRIQWGTSLAYPLSSMGAHVAAVPNHQTGRITPIETRAAVAFFGVFGYELDPTTLAADERRAVAEQIAFYKANRELFQRGRFVRLRSPFEEGGNETAWMVVAPDASRAIVGFYQVLKRPVPAADRLRLRGLDPDAVYRVSGWPDRRRPARPGQRRRTGRRRADASRAVARREPPRGGRVGRLPRLAVRPRGGLDPFRGAFRHTFTDLIGPHRTDLDHTRPTRRSTCGPRGDDAQSRHACAPEMAMRTIGWLDRLTLRLFLAQGADVATFLCFYLLVGPAVHAERNPLILGLMALGGPRPRSASSRC